MSLTPTSVRATTTAEHAATDCAARAGLPIDREVDGEVGGAPPSPRTAEVVIDHERRRPIASVVLVLETTR